MHLKIRRWSGPEWTLFTLAFFAISIILVESFGFPRSILYLGDVLNIFVLFNAISVRSRFHQHASKIEAGIVLFLLVSMIGSVLNFESPLLLLWGLRNNSRMFICYINCTTYLKKEHYYKVLAVLEGLFWLSLPLCFIERFFFTYSGAIIGDMIGGFFWNYSGCNAPLNVLLCIVVARITIEYFKGKKSFAYFAMCIFAALFMSAMAELKVFIPEMFIIFVAVVLTLKVNTKIMIKILVCVMMVSLVLSFFISVFVVLNGRGKGYADNFTLQGILDYATRDTGYDGVGDLNRMQGLSRVADEMLNNDIISIFFGKGLGSAEYTKFFISDFYRAYGNLHYQYFHHIWMFIEVGVVGIYLFLRIIIKAFFNAKSSYMEDEDVSFVKVVAIFALFLFVYNTSLRGETTAPIIYMMLAMPEVLKKESKLNSCNKKGRVL